ncbi:hypothetical protein C0075_01090 [Rhizobium sp. KAs_5_22]|nr:hypothetical protein [Ciceribacter selenitireducens]PPJ49202.1 hypothetical protein C0075_01090 [Rhizobium sp. KAs_5_22]
MHREDGVRPRRGGRFQPRATRRFSKSRAGGTGAARFGKANPLQLVLMLIIALAGYATVGRAGPVDRHVAFVSTQAADQLSASLAVKGGPESQPLRSEKQFTFFERRDA